MTSLTIDQKATTYSVRHALCMARAADVHHGFGEALEKNQN
ncbi:hypothetical protein [Streptomyces lydicus]